MGRYSLVSVCFVFLISILTTPSRAAPIDQVFDRALELVSLNEAKIFERATYFIKPNWRYVNGRAAAACDGAAETPGAPDMGAISTDPTLAQAICLFDFTSVGALGLGAIDADLAGCGNFLDATDFPFILALWVGDPGAAAALRYLSYLPAAAASLKSTSSPRSARAFWASFGSPAADSFRYFPVPQTPIDRVARDGAVNFLTRLAGDPRRDTLKTLYGEVARDVGVLRGDRPAPDVVAALGARYRARAAQSQLVNADEPLTSPKGWFADQVFAAAEAFYADKVRLCRMQGVLATLTPGQRPVVLQEQPVITRVQPSDNASAVSGGGVERVTIIGEAGQRFCCRVGERFAVYTRRQCSESRGQITSEKACVGVVEGPRDHCCLVARGGRSLAGWVSRKECRRARGRMIQSRACWAYFDL